MLVSSTDFYVSNQRGDDRDPGTKEQPFKSLRKAFDSIYNNDKIYVEQGLYEETITNLKSVILIGIISGHHQPVYDGLLTNSGFGKIEVHNFDFTNTKTSYVFRCGTVGTLVMKNVRFYNTKKSSHALYLNGMSEKVELEDVSFLNTDGMYINGANFRYLKQVIFKRVQFIGGDATGIHFDYIENLSVDGLQMIRNCLNTPFGECGIVIDHTKQFIFQNTILTRSKQGFTVKNSVGQIVNSEVSQISRNNGAFF